MTLKHVVSLLVVFAFSAGFFVTSTFAATHTVKKDESLATIAKKYSTTQQTLIELNKLDSNKVKKGNVLKLPAHIKNKPAVVKKAKKEKTYTMLATAYTANCKGCSGITKTGINLRKNPKMKVIAVDPKIIPLGSKVWVEGYGTAIAGDTGGAIKGNKIDIFISSKSTAYKWGRRTVKVKVLNS